MTPHLRAYRGSCIFTNVMSKLSVSLSMFSSLSKTARLSADFSSESIMFPITIFYMNDSWWNSYVCTYLIFFNDTYKSRQPKIRFPPTVYLTSYGLPPQFRFLFQKHPEKSTTEGLCRLEADLHHTASVLVYESTEVKGCLRYCIWLLLLHLRFWRSRCQIGQLLHRFVREIRGFLRTLGNPFHHLQ